MDRDGDRPGRPGASRRPTVARRRASSPGEAESTELLEVLATFEQGERLDAVVVDRRHCGLTGLRRAPRGNGPSVADDRERRDMDPGEMTRRMPEGEGAGPGAPETLEPTQGERATPGPGGPAMEGLAHHAPEGDPGSPRIDPERRADPDAATAPIALWRTAATAVRRLLGRGGHPPQR